MIRLNTMDYAADFLRGWPNEGALESSGYPIAAGQTLSAGNLVVLNSSGELVASPASEINFAGIVVRGNSDDKSVEASGNAIVLWGGYIVRTTKIDAGVMALDPMAPVNANGGVFVEATSAVVTSASLGFVLETVIGQNGAPDSAVIVVK